MKKLLKVSVFLALIGITITSTQMSCSKTSAQTSTYTLPPATTSTLGGVIIGSGLSVTNNGTLSVNATSGLQQLNILLYVKRTGSPMVYEIWTVNYDGTNQKKINISLPSGQFIYEEGRTPKLSPDGKTIFFNASDNTSDYVYSCNVDGTNIKQLIHSSDFYSLSGAY